jgi:ketosteroid isomerase-like protein
MGIMKSLINFIVISFLLFSCSTSKNSIGADNDRKALEQTSISIREAFAKGDIPTIISYHHPDVVKALGYKNFLNGRDAVEADLKGTLKKILLNFKENKVESLLIKGNVATEIALFTIEGTPKDGSKPFTFKGRAMIVYVRYKASPTGWASIREVIQPATD